MTLCANCPSPARWLYSRSNTQNTFFCAAHAPRSLRSVLVHVPEEVVDEKKSTKKSTTSTVIKSTPEEEVVDSKSDDNEPTEEEVTDNESDK